MKKAMQEKMAILEAKFPKAWFKDGGEFSSGHENTIWTGEGSFVYDPAYDFEVGIFKWDFTIHPMFESVLDDLGLWAEYYDGGTVFIYER